ncbi:MAG: glycosyltransferase family 39 protein [Gammaproteobacteria bacterium]|nr:glycosyltransferase family 39 protein [Gammaproteobacteria bacterium]
MNYPLSSVDLWRPLFWTAVITAFFVNLHGFPLFDLDEGAYTETTREMLLRGDLITTYMNGQPFYDKPILMYWLQALSVTILGQNEFGWRLPSALASTAWVLAVQLFMARVVDRRSGYLAGSVVALSLLVALIGKAAIPDGVLNFCISAAMFAIYLYYREGQRRWIICAFVAMGLGFLDKGPIAVLIPLVSSAMFFASRRQLGRWWRAALDPVGIMLFLAIAAPWYVAAYLREGQAFIDGFFFKHNVGRFTSAMEGHGGSVFYYVPVILIGSLPFTSALLLALRHVRELIHDDLKLFLLLWFGFVLVFFSLSGTKLPHYLNYGLTGLLIIAALYVDRLRTMGWAVLPLLLYLLALLCLPELLGLLMPGIDQPFFHDSLADYPRYLDAGYRAIIVVAIILTVLLLLLRRYSLTARLMAGGLLCVGVTSMTVLPAVGAMVQQPIKEAALMVRNEPARVISYRMNMPSFSVYAQRVVAKATPRPGDIVFTTPSFVAELGPSEQLYQRGGVALVRILPAASR